MTFASHTVFYVFTFLAIYVQVFFLITFFENRKKIIIRGEKIKLSNYPAVTVIVPCFNEEGTIDKTVQSLFNLNYPQDKINIFLVDDGSTDGTLNTLQKFTSYKNVKIFHKENGGKHTALNLGLANVETEFLGCLDADSFVDPESLSRIMSYFQKDPSSMAVAPSIIVNNPKTIIQKAQKAEYYMAVYVKKMLGFLGAIHVTPGPLTIFRKKVFDNLGPYRSAHNTEDMEIAYRMQKNHYKIEQCNDAYVYTNAPRTIGKLYKQRLRWIYGFINNTIDYRGILFRKKYGNFSTFTIPAGIISIFAVSYLFGRIVYNFADLLSSKILQFKAVGFHIASSANNFDPYFISTNSFIFIKIFLYSLIIFSIILGYRMATNKWSFSWSMIYFFIIFSLAAPFWLLRAVYATAISRQPTRR
jgi:cellulose synthase/poly-beta-1,6-N-acetylglucosamine synthase-like glycosyltransferase